MQKNEQSQDGLWWRVLAVVLILGASWLYYPINQTISGGIESKIFFDDFIPFWPIWAVPYILSIGWWVAAAFWASAKMDKKMLQTLVAAVLIMNLSSYLVYIFIPTYAIRPEPVGNHWAMSLIRSIYRIDQPYNLLPSGHTYNTMIIAIFWWLWKPKHRWVWAFTAPVVILSTLFTKQHYFLDPVFGVIWAFGSFYIASRVMKWRPETDRTTPEQFWRAVWRVVWGLFIIFMLAIFFTYLSMPVDGAAGDLSSYSSEGFEVLWVIEEREGGLMVGDIVTAVGGIPVEDWITGVLTPGLVWENGGNTAYQVLRGGQSVELEIELKPLAFGAFIRHWGLQLFGVLATIAVGSFVLWKQPDYPAARWFMLFCMANAIQIVGDGWNFNIALHAHPDLFWVHLLNEHGSYPIIFVSAFMLGISFPRQYSHARKYRFEGWIALGLFVLMAGLIFGTFAVVSPFSEALRASNKVAVTSAGVFLLLTIGVLWRNYKQTEDRDDRERIKWWMFLGLVVAIVAIPFYYLPVLYQKAPLLSHPVTSAVVMIGLPAAFSLGILGVQMFDIDLLINRSLVYGALTYILLALFGVSLYVVEEIAVSVAGEQRSLLAVAISAAIFGALFQPTRRRLQRFVDRRLYNIGLDYEEGTRVKEKIESAQMDFRQTIKIDPFEELEYLGSGGMAVLFKAYHPTLEQPVAIKLLPPHLVNDKFYSVRFEREARLVAELHHPNIIQVYDHGVQNANPYMVMEFIEGMNLSQYIRIKGRLKPKDSLYVAENIASALDYAHDLNLVHRDVKSSNIMLELDSPVYVEDAIKRAVLTDFGVTKMLSTDSTLMTFNAIIGSFDFIAPEQVEEASKVDRRADIYSLGMVVYQMLAGRMPFDSKNPGVLLMAHLHQMPDDPREFNPDIPEPVALAIMRAIEKDPKKRFDSAGEFIRTLKKGSWGFED